VPTSYDEVAYPPYAFAQTHPDRLGALAAIFGMTPAPVERCRVLELGCGNGSNLIPMAFSLPGSRFVGVDLAATQVEIGAAGAAALELKNIELRHLDVLDIRREFGEFDYIIAHGLYSWVPLAVREKVFEVCRENLAPNGVGYVSYNTFPGGHMRRLVREILLYHTRNIRDPKERIREALSLARYLSLWKHDQDNERDLLRAEFARVLGYDPGHFYHDDLAGVNSPVYFHEFMEQASRHGLQYLAEADFYEMQGPPAAPEGPEAPRLPSPGDLIEFEQYIDFLRCRRFRQTLLCRDDVALDRTLAPARLRGLYLASPLRPASQTPDLGYGKVERFTGPKNSEIETDFPAAKAALTLLSGIYPSSLRFEDLLRRSRALAAAGQTNGDDWPEQIARELAAMLLKMFAAKVVEVAAGPSRFTVEVSERPQTSRLVRKQLEAGDVVVNQLHHLVEVRDGKARLLLRLADGTRDLAALRGDLAAALQAEISEEDLIKTLRNAARGAMLVG
jgi:SAM-dependent methyltransferase